MQTKNQEKLLKDRVDTTYSNAVSANISLLIGSILFVIVFQNGNVNQTWLHIWALALASLAIIRLLTREVRQKYNELCAEKTWSTIYSIQTGIIGLIWAASSFIAIQADNLFEIGALYILLSGVLTAAISVLSATPKAFYAYILPTSFVFSIIPFFFDNIPIFLSVCVIMVSIFSISTSRILSKRIYQVFSLQQENKDLEHEISERQIKEKNLQHIAHHDALTNLPNRLLLNTRLNQSISNIENSKINKLAVLYIDLDNFKNVNDDLGHVIGDKLLQEVSLRLIEGVRYEDTIARVGGDEFVMLVENAANVENISNFTQKVMTIINTPISIEGNDLHISASIGISLYPEDGNIPEKLIKAADNAMLQAKQSGRHNFQFYTKNLTATALQKVKMQNELILALKEDQFEIHYQIQPSLLSKKIIGVEALVRWRHPLQGLLSPAIFLPIAKESGLLADIGSNTLRKACHQMAKWRQENIDIGRISVNIAGVQIQSLELTNTVTTICHSSGCKPDWLTLEIDETFIMQKSGKTVETLQKLRSLGVQITIDNFGTSYSSLKYLKKLPVNTIKIDRSFIKNIESNIDDADITKSIISLGKILKLKVLAEGIEQQHQETFLIEAGCNYAQGNHYSKPVTAEEITHLYNRFNMTKNLSLARDAKT